MTKFKTFALVAGLAIASMSAPAFAAGATDGAAAKAAPAATHKAARPASKSVAADKSSAQPAGMPSYALLHKSVAAGFNRFKEALSSDEVQAGLKQLPIELAKLPPLEKAYVDAKTAGRTDEAKAASDAYLAVVQTVIDIALPIDQHVGETKEGISKSLARLGPIGEKLMSEKDIVATTQQIDELLKPLDAANEQVGPLQTKAAKAASVRLKLVEENIQKEEISAQVTNYLQGKLGQ